MKPLKTELNRHGHSLRQIWRNDSLALYERSKAKNYPPHELEFIVIRKHKETLFPNGFLTPEREAFPSDEQWGSFAWSWPIKTRDFLLNLLKAEPLSLKATEIRDKVRAYLKTV